MLTSNRLRRFRVAVVVGIAAAFVLAVAISPMMRQELSRAADILANGNVAALRAYILSFGIWARLRPRC